MWENFLQFWSFTNPNVRWVALGSVMLGWTTAVIGCFAFLQKKSLAGDALAHAALPGITSAFLIFHDKSPLIVIGGAVVSCLIAYAVSEYFQRYTKIKPDSGLAIILSLFFSIGIFQLTIIQKLPLASQAGLDRMLFGQAAALVKGDLYVLLVLSVLINLFVVFSYKKLKLIIFDPVFARTVNVNVVFWKSALALALVLSIVIGLQLVGVVLMAALLLTPATSARFWTHKLKLMLMLSGIFGATAGLLGANISYLMPKMPSGPWMVLILSSIFLISAFFAPEKGILARFLRRRAIALRINSENILRSLYKLSEQQSFEQNTDFSRLMLTLNLSFADFKKALQNLKSKRFVSLQGDSVNLTAEGLAKAAELTRFHRLWELYLTSKLELKSDHVHADAEEIEHWFNRELEDKLLLEIGDLKIDPHGQEIPSRKL